MKPTAMQNYLKKMLRTAPKRTLLHNQTWFHAAFLHVSWLVSYPASKLALILETGHETGMRPKAMHELPRKDPAVRIRRVEQISAL